MANEMDRPPDDMAAAATFVLRFWREWSGTTSRWRGRIEHVQSGQRAEFLEVKTLIGFLERFGVSMEADRGSREVTNGETGGGNTGSETSFR